MKISIDTRNPENPPKLLDPEDFKGFKVVVEGPVDSLPEAISSVGRLLDTGDALIETRAVREMAGERARDANWTESFEAMLGYAKSKGWMSEDGSAIQAHCEPVS